jgi:hypothetical protein
MTRKSTVKKQCNCKHHVGNRNISLSDFYRNKTNKQDGHNWICKLCQEVINTLRKKEH